MPINKILIVDDSSTARHFLLDILVKAGYEVISAESGDEAILKVKAEMPDLVLMDIIMPGINGYQATRTITKDEATKHIPVLFVTRRDRQPAPIGGMPTGAAAFLSKPI